jgi:hypothetical protein
VYPENTPAISASLPTPKPFGQVLSPKFLLGIYGIIPFIGLLILIDYLFFDMQISEGLPGAKATGWLNIIFMLPHIMASFFTFVDKDYIVAYRVRLIVSSFVILSGVLLAPLWLGGGAIILVGVIYTAYHQASQMTGIAALVAKNKAATHTAWKWLYFLLLMVMVAAGPVAQTPEFSFLAQPPLSTLFKFIYIILFSSYLVVSILTVKNSKTFIGLLYIAAGSSLILVDYALFSLDMYLYVLIITRFLHDVTAFSFYVSHNITRNQSKPLSAVSIISRTIPLPEYILTPAIALLSTIAMSIILPKQILFTASAFLVFFHYYWEGIMWKHGSPHRKNLSF